VRTLASIHRSGSGFSGALNNACLAPYDEATKTWISAAEVAEISFTAFTSRKKNEHITGRLVVRRIPELNKKDLEHPTLSDTHRFHAFFTTSDLPTVAADKTTGLTRSSSSSTRT